MFAGNCNLSSSVLASLCRANRLQLWEIRFAKIHFLGSDWFISRPLMNLLFDLLQESFSLAFKSLSDCARTIHVSQYRPNIYHKYRYHDMTGRYLAVNIYVVTYDSLDHKHVVMDTRQ